MGSKDSAEDQPPSTLGDLDPGIRRDERGLLQVPKSRGIGRFYTYILASKRNGTLYTGSTDDIIKRMYEHREKVRRGFTSKYGVTILVWYEQHETRDVAFRRERQIKEWRRSWKLRLIEEHNPTWRDLYEDLF